MTVTHLADACALIVYLSEPDPERVLSRESVALLRQGAAGVSPITVWEITRKTAIGTLPSTWADYASLPALLQEQGFPPVSLTWQDAAEANRLPSLHKGPMDRMLVAQALRLGAPVITEDAIFRGYGVRTLW